VPGAIDTSLNIALWEGQLGPDGDKSVVAVVNGQPIFSTARLVYGELRGGKYQILWDSPLFNLLHANIYFRDVNNDGAKEIVIESTTYGNQEYPILVIFDKEGREITRQRKCDTLSGTGDNFNQEDGTCAIFGEDITFSENEEGPKEIYVKNWDDSKNHIFKLNRDSSYVPGPPVAGSFPPEPPLPPPPPDPAQLNQQGIRLMRLKDYTSAIIAFERADLFAAHKNPEYANNVGFAMYKAGRYEASVDWLNTTISLDPKRAVAYLNLGDALIELKRIPEAREAYKKYLELAPDSKAVPDVKKKLDALPPIR
jgi:tetratricopeptide (TPR) repeat protein